MPEVPPSAVAAILGRRGRLVGDHPWAGRSGEIVRVEKTVVGFAVVVRLDVSGQEVMVFDGRRHWRSEPPKGGPKIWKLIIGDWPGSHGDDDEGGPGGEVA